MKDIVSGLDQNLVKHKTILIMVDRRRINVIDLSGLVNKSVIRVFEDVIKKTENA